MVTKIGSRNSAEAVGLGICSWPASVEISGAVMLHNVRPGLPGTAGPKVPNHPGPWSVVSVVPRRQE